MPLKCGFWLFALQSYLFHFRKDEDGMGERAEEEFYNILSLSTPSLLGIQEKVTSFAFEQNYFFIILFFFSFQKMNPRLVTLLSLIRVVESCWSFIRSFQHELLRNSIQNAAGGSSHLCFVQCILNAHIIYACTAINGIRCSNPFLNCHKSFTFIISVATRTT